jgi:HD superfamily phosphohydrolase
MNPMQITDRVYGKIAITDEVLIELIHSAPIQRLKRIDQAGAFQYALPGKTVSRYEHTVGVMLLLRKLGASLEEQIAGLLHDVPHTAFSHVIDFVFQSKEHSHDFHEKFHEKILMASEIPAILKKYGFDIARLLDEHNFSLLERSAPDLCADRIDYALRDFAAFEDAATKARKYMPSLCVHNGEIIFKNRNAAVKFAEHFIRMNEQYWAHQINVAMYQILADAMKIAMERGILTEKDLFQDDAHVYSKLKSSHNPEILKLLGFLRPDLKLVEDSESCQFHSRTKLRYVDPKFLNPDGTVSKVSDNNQKFATRLNKYKVWVEKGHHIRIVS